MKLLLDRLCFFRLHHLLFSLIVFHTASYEALLFADQKTLYPEYDDFISKNRPSEWTSSEQTAKIVGGSVGLAAGIAGEIFFEDTILTKLVFTTTQSTSFVLIVDGLLPAFSVSAHEELDKTLSDLETQNLSGRRAKRYARRRKRQISYQLFEEKKRDSLRRVALSSGFFVIYGVNGLRAGEEAKAIRNTYLFFSANALLVALFSTLEYVLLTNNDRYELSLGPMNKPLQEPGLGVTLNVRL